MWNNTNPTSLYLGTTWELLPSDLFIKTGNTPLQQAGSNSIKLSKANLPAEKLKIDSFNLTINKPKVKIFTDWSGMKSATGYVINDGITRGDYDDKYTQVELNTSTSSASPYTQNLGDGTPITINPTHITLKAWKRLS